MPTLDILTAIDARISGLQEARRLLAGEFLSKPKPRKATAAPTRRRRPRMTAAQKKAVSARMKAYWAKRRKTDAK